MIDNTKETIDSRVVELDGIRYVILRETAFHSLCRKAHVDGRVSSADEKTVSDGLDMDRALLARKLVRRRRVAGLSQAELARRAGIRPETLNRLERGRTTPDFATIRKLVLAMNAAEQQQNPPLISTSPNEEK